MQTMILTSQDQLKNLDNVGAVLIYPSRITTSELIQSATSNDLVINCIVDDDPDNAFIGQSLSQLGYPSGCYIVINYQNKKTAEEITNTFSSNLQLGYRAAIIVNKSDYTQDDFKVFSQYGIIVIDHNDVENYVLTVPEFITSRSLAMIRDYTNVDIDDVGPGAYVGIGKDTSGLGGGRSFGYSTNGQDFYAVITPKGLVFRQIDALRMWRLLKPQQDAQIDDFFNNKVAKEIEAQNESLESAVATANSAVNAANQAVNDSKANSDAIKDKADQSQITQLANQMLAKVSTEDFQAEIALMQKDINLRISKGDLISQINLEAGGDGLIQVDNGKGKLFLDADSVVFSGKAFIPDAAIANLSLDKLTTGHITIPLTDKFGNEIELGREGIEISSLYSSIDRKEPDSSANSNDSSASSSQTDNNAVQAASLMTSFAAIANQPDDSGGSSSNGNIPDQPDNPDHPDTYTKSASYRMRLTADGLRMIQRVHYKNDRDGKESDRDFTELQVSPVDVVGAETTDGANGLAFVTGVDDNDYTTGNQPASFLALGNGKKTNEKGTTFHNLDVIYSATSRSGYPAGMNVNTHLHILPPGADHGIRTAWVSWSNWDGGEKYPALVQDGSNWGGVAFPKSGRVTLFDANGRYYTPDRNTGIGSYNNYGGEK